MEHDRHNNFAAKAIHLFMNMDKMIGGQFEKGLAEMKSIVEASPSDSAETFTPKERGSMAAATESQSLDGLVGQVTKS